MIIFAFPKGFLPRYPRGQLLIGSLCRCKLSFDRCDRMAIRPKQLGTRSCLKCHFPLGLSDYSLDRFGDTGPVFPYPPVVSRLNP